MLTQFAKGEHMCGIIGYCGHRPAVPIVIEGLGRLEYRGYDSSGIAFLQGDTLEIVRAAGKLACLETKLASMPTMLATVSIGHTRWATHGLPVEKNAHPHQSADGVLAIVHNGIIENYQELKNDLCAKNIQFASDTDTEILANLIADEFHGLRIQEYGDMASYVNHKEAYPLDAILLEKAFCTALEKAHGAYAVVMVSPLVPQQIYAARLSAPLLIGMGVGEFFVASDVPAFLPYTREVIFLEDEEIAILNATSCLVKSLKDGVEITKQLHHIPWDMQGAAKDGYKHFMLKEIMEQPKILRDCLAGRVVDNEIRLPELDGMDVPSRIRILACGTSYNAGLWSQYYFEQLAGICVSVEIASEFRYRKPVLDEKELILVISQSGETADTLGALRLCKEKGHNVVGLCNVLGSSLAREAYATVYTQAGPEISVASTKAMLSQMVVLLLMAMSYGQQNRFSTDKTRAAILAELIRLPNVLEESLPRLREQANILAKKYAFARSFFFLGRGTAFPLALEGALKLKELSYIHAEGYAVGEMKHGPIALIDPEFPSFVITFDDEHFIKVRSGIQEIQSRQGKVIVLKQDNCHVDSEDVWSIPSSSLPEFLALPAMQLFSYEMADYLGKDVDQPRNLAKSVTVE